MVPVIRVLFISVVSIRPLLPADNTLEGLLAYHIPALKSAASVVILPPPTAVIMLLQTETPAAVLPATTVLGQLPIVIRTVL